MIQGGAAIMDNVFDDPDEEAEKLKARPEIVTMLVTIYSNEPSKTVELRGFEPLTFCMPCTVVSSEAVPLSLVLAVQGVTTVRGRRAGSGGTCARSHLLSHWFSDLPSQGGLAPRRFW